MFDHRSHDGVGVDGVHGGGGTGRLMGCHEGGVGAMVAMGGVGMVARWAMLPILL